MTEAIIQIQDLEKRFRSKNTEVYALQGINLTIRKGDIFGIIGKSGAGKSTLVRCINLLERPTGGRLRKTSAFRWSLPESKRTPPASGRASCLSWSTCPTGHSPTRRSFRADKSSASPSPALWLPTPRSSCATRLLPPSTPPLRNPSFRSSRTSTGAWGSPPSSSRTK